MKDEKSNPSINELVSTLMDGEASDFELRRVIAETGSDSESSPSTAWARYHIIKSAIQKDLPDSVGIEISARISDALLKEPDHRSMASIDDTMASTDDKSHGFNWLRPAASVAVAASVAFAVVFGWQNLQYSNDRETLPTSMAQSSAASLPNPYRNELPMTHSVGASQVVQFNGYQNQGTHNQGVHNQLASSRQNYFDENGLELLSDNPFGKASGGQSTLTSQHQQRLNSYFFTHTSHAALNTSRGMMPYVRVVDMPAAKKTTSE